MNINNWITLFALILLVSCNPNESKNDDENSHRPGREMAYKFIAVDALSPELQTTYYSGGGGVISLWMDLKASTFEFKQKNILTNDWAQAKEDHLRKEMKTIGLYEHPIEGDYERLFICAGVSGDVIIYADEIIGDLKAGEDLSDLFECAAKGRIKYPEMDIIEDQILLEAIKEEKYPYYVWYNYNEYFSEKIIPLCGTDGYVNPLELRVKQDPHFFDVPHTLHFVIPITGLDKEGNEKSMVLTGVCSTTPQE